MTTITESTEMINGFEYQVKNYGDNVWYSGVVDCCGHLPYDVIKEYADEDEQTECVEFIVKHRVLSYEYERYDVIVTLGDCEYLEEMGILKYRIFKKKLDALEVDIRGIEDDLQQEQDEEDDEDIPLREEIDMSIFGRKECGMMDDDEINELFGGEIYGDNVDSSMMLNLYEQEDYDEERNYPEFVDMEEGAMHDKVSILMCQARKVNVVIDLAYRTTPTQEGWMYHEFIMTMWFNDVLVYRNVFGEVKRGYLKKGLMYDIIQHNKAYIEKQRIRNECSKNYCVVVDKFVSGNTNLNNDCISRVMGFVY